MVYYVAQTYMYKTQVPDMVCMTYMNILDFIKNRRRYILIINI